MMPFPVRFVGEDLPAPEKAPTPGQHRDKVLGDVLDYDEAKIAELEAAGAFGKR